MPDTRSMINHGLELAAKAGHPDPRLGDAVWELILEAMETLRRLPDREIGWLKSAERSHMPDMIRKLVEEFGAEVEHIAMGEGPRETVVHPGPPSKGAIDRAEIVLNDWYQLGGSSRKARRNAQTLYLLAAGVPPRIVARITKVNGRHYRNTLYSRRDRHLREIIVQCEEELGNC